MSRFTTDTVTAPLPGGCQCKGTPHERDEVYLLPTLTYDGGAAADAAMQRTLGSGDAGLVTREVVRAYLTHQVAGWNLLTDDGAPLPYDPALLLSDWTAALAVGDVADDLYSEVLLAPLREAASTSSPGGPTAASTSARTRSASTPRKR